MLNYYFRLALVSFRRNWRLTLLMVAAIALGVAMTMTAYTVLYVMSRDPIPEKSNQLFTVQIDNGGPRSRNPGDNEPPTQLSYPDAMALLNAHAARRQVAMHEVPLTVVPADPRLTSFPTFGRAVTADFFAMFDVPMLYGHGWDESDDSRSAPVVVLSKRLNMRLFGGTNSVGQSLKIGDDTYRVVGVIGSWDPKPRFYDVIGGQSFDEGEDIYLPLSVTIVRKIYTSEYVWCYVGSSGTTFDDLRRSECVWLQFWVQLPAAGDVIRYRDFLDNYARDQRRAGRFAWPPNNRLRNVREWLVAQKVVPDDARISVIVAFGFFVVCLVSALSLMLAKEFGRAPRLGMRRALGASRWDVFAQVVVESGIVGLLGGAGGLCLASVSLWGIRVLFPAGMNRIAQMDGRLVAVTIVFAVAATLVAGIYPAWVSTRVPPALQIKGG
ncbi:MAG TPA: ABC transporter permease [Steroidobacteraceae bacterium]